MPKISDAKREARRAEIVDAALGCFKRSGYQRTSMADIIAESGLSAGAIYGYFPSKSDLVLTVAARILDARRAELALAETERTLSPAGIAQLLVQGVRSEAPLPVLIQVWGEATVDPELRTLLQHTLGDMRGTIADALQRWAVAHPDQVPDDPARWAHATAPVTMSLIPGFVLQSALFDEFDGDAFLAALPGLLPHAE
ncbi:TetR/AcrR family transcriptional regulator [Microbacterium fluvii]|uniref:TetR/AcrR family transcriptional regulator n=1 Tax=Microbacterium fluvii TaxID=415215 RepID=A0ABW2H7Q5_9MICO|nr:TetR/AcrR family transcriptional regulator [Microbacterium fluvii]MCU4671014.1 TetR/AcrR family transcriptional regulator [Microbacterium fluvii]